MQTQEQWEARLRATDEYRKAVELMETIKATEVRLKQLRNSLAQTGEAGQLARLDAMERAMNHGLVASPAVSFSHNEIK